jgi:hypothetical protein
MARPSFNGEFIALFEISLNYETPKKC